MPGSSTRYQNLKIRLSYRGDPAATYRYVVGSLPFGSYHENFPEIHVDQSGETGPGSRRGGKVRLAQEASCSPLNWLASPFPTPPQQDHFRRLPMPSSRPLSPQTACIPSDPSLRWRVPGVTSAFRLETRRNVVRGC